MLKAQNEQLSKQIQLEEIYPILQETLENGGEFCLTITGTSMVPTIRGGRDRVTLIKAPQRLQQYDLPLYRRKNGAFVLHRVVEVSEEGSYVMCGDHQWQKEPGILPEQIVGVVSVIERKGKIFSVENGHYRRWVRFWCRMLPLRKSIFWVISLPTAVKRRILRKK